MSANRAGRPAIIIGILLLLAGVVTALSSLVVVGNRLGPAFQSAFLNAPLAAPGRVNVTLTPGTWSLYLADAAAISQGGTTSAAFVAVQPKIGLTAFDVTVTGPDGKQLTLRDVTATTTDTITRNQVIYTAVLSFDVAATGDYQVVVANNDGTQLIIAPSLRDLGNFVPWGAIGGIGVGGCVFLAGVVVLVIGLVSTTRARRSGGPVLIPAVAATALPPPGWYPDPMRSAHWRYWDGQGWTAHTG